MVTAYKIYISAKEMVSSKSISHEYITHQPIDKCVISAKYNKFPQLIFREIRLK